MEGYKMKSTKKFLVIFLALILLMNSVTMAQKEITVKGLTASEMLLKGMDNLGETYKLTMDLKVKKLTGFSKQLVPDPKNSGMFIEKEQEINQIIEDHSFVVGVVEKNDEISKEYYKSISLLDPTATSEQLLEQNIFYGRMGNGKWQKHVTNPIVVDIIKETEKELIKIYATYASDEIINGKNYYKISYQPNYDFKKVIALKVMDQIVNKSLTTSDTKIDEDEIKTLLLKEISKKDKDLSTTYYINQETQVLELMHKTEIVTFTYDKMDIKLSNTSESKYYDSNQPVIFPEIVLEDIQ